MNRQDVIALYFEGDAALYEEYAAMCREQFVVDIEAGDKACHSGDAASLGTLAHSLKTVLLSLGRTELSEIALAIEAHAAKGDMPALTSAWEKLRLALPGALD